MPPGPHAVTSSTFGSYGYDAIGNQMSAAGRIMEYKSFGLPKNATVEGGWTTTFLYDAFGTRVAKRISGSSDTTYVGGLYERRREGEDIRHVLYVAAEDRVVGQLVVNEAQGQVTSEEMLYLHDDHLGSVETVTSGPGQVVGRLRFDPFGSLVRPERPSEAGGEFPSNVRLGFTGHEHDGELGLINMKGRVYEPKTGHFLTPDPLVPDPFWGPAFNRYAYVYNNPLTLTDPTGFQADVKTPPPFCVVCTSPRPPGPPVEGGSGGKGGDGRGNMTSDDGPRTEPKALPPPKSWTLSPNERAQNAANTSPIKN